MRPQKKEVNDLERERENVLITGIELEAVEEGVIQVTLIRRVVNEGSNRRREADLCRSMMA